MTVNPPSGESIARELLAAEIASLLVRIDSVLESVAQCADVVDRINILADRKNFAQNEARSLKSNPPRAPSLEERTNYNARIKELEDATVTMQREIDTLFEPFPDTREKVRNLVGDVQRALADLLTEPPQLRDIRSEMERLGLWAETPVNFLPLSMRNAKAELPIVKNRLSEMTVWLAKESKRPTARSKNPHRERLKAKVVEMRSADFSHKRMCNQLDDERLSTPKNWEGITWKRAYLSKRKTVDSYLSRLK